MSANAVVIPGALSRDDLDASAKGWSVESGQPERGDAWTNHTTCRIRIPMDDSPESEAIRMHELMHVKVSPRLVIDYMSLGVRPEIVEACEEIRVNELARRVGIDLDLMVDGSEKYSGTRVRHDRDSWRGAVRFTAATHGGKAQREFLLGIKKSNPDWVKPLRCMVKDLNRAMKRLNCGSWSSTELDDAGMPKGFSYVIAELGRAVEAYWVSDPDASDPETRKAISRATASGRRRAPSGEWAELIVGETDLSVTVTGASVSRKRHPAQSGTRVGYASRILTDPQRRVFAGVKRGGSGVVLIDMSGSMDIEAEQIDELLKVARGLTVLGYSHKPGDTTGTPNAWVLARNGRRVASQDLRSGNIGNGVDVPALKWAQKFRESGQPLVWVFDGKATDSNDHPFGSEECAKFIKRNKVHCVHAISDAIDAFKRGHNLNSTKFPYGRVGQYARGEVV